MVERVHRHIDQHWAAHLAATRAFVRQPSISADGTVVLWPTDEAEATRLALADIGDPPTDQERRHYLPEPDRPQLRTRITTRLRGALRSRHDRLATRTDVRRLLHIPGPRTAADDDMTGFHASRRGDGVASTRSTAD